MSARIIPFQKRNTFAEYRRRRALVLSFIWGFALLPLGICCAIWRREPLEVV